MANPGDAATLLSDEHAEPSDALTEEERAYFASEVDGVLATFAGSLSDEDLAFMRETLLRSARDARRGELVRAATPRAVDESGEILRRPDVSLARKKLASSDR